MGQAGASQVVAGGKDFRERAAVGRGGLGAVEIDVTPGYLPQQFQGGIGKEQGVDQLLRGAVIQVSVAGPLSK